MRNEFRQLYQPRSYRRSEWLRRVWSWFRSENGRCSYLLYKTTALLGRLPCATNSVSSTNPALTAVQNGCAVSGAGSEPSRQGVRVRTLSWFGKFCFERLRGRTAFGHLQRVALSLKESLP